MELRVAIYLKSILEHQIEHQMNRYQIRGVSISRKIVFKTRYI